MKALLALVLLVGSGGAGVVEAFEDGSAIVAEVDGARLVRDAETSELRLVVVEGEWK